MIDEQFLKNVRHDEDVEFMNAISIFVEESEFLIGSVLGALTLYTEDEWEYVTCINNTENCTVDFLFVHEDNEEIVSVKVNAFRNPEEIEAIVDKFVLKYSNYQNWSLSIN